MPPPPRTRCSIGAGESSLPTPASIRFWSIVAERRGDFDNAAVLAGFADALAAAASLARPEADVRIIEASRRLVEEALGSERYTAQYQRGSEMNWEELPLLREAARARIE